MFVGGEKIGDDRVSVDGSSRNWSGSHGDGGGAGCCNIRKCGGGS